MTARIGVITLADIAVRLVGLGGVEIPGLGLAKRAVDDALIAQPIRPGHPAMRGRFTAAALNRPGFAGGCLV